jgi:hypothetical protein
MRKLSKAFSDGADVIVSDYATTRLTAETVAKMDAYNKNWRTLGSVRRKLEKQVSAGAKAAWESGATLETF